jgi:GntR family transcriptional regulator
VDEISRKGPLWPYQELVVRLREDIAAMAINDPLPSVRRLSQEHGVAEKTARKALRVLEEEGLVYVVPSRGAFVAGKR